MSVDYYYVCHKLKIYMPAFSFQSQGLWHAHFDGLLEWTSKTATHKVVLIQEQTKDWELMYDENYKYINPYKRENS